jgi:hypothetical protein
MTNVVNGPAWDFLEEIKELFWSGKFRFVAIVERFHLLIKRTSGNGVYIICLLY